MSNRGLYVEMGQREDENGDVYYEVVSKEQSDLARFYFDSKDNEARASALADAELFSAAPDLLEALQALVDSIDALGKQSSPKMDAARAALQKVKP